MVTDDVRVSSNPPVRFIIDLSPEAWLLLIKHGYNPALPARGVAGGPGERQGYLIGSVGSTRYYLPLRNHVCYLEGIEIDGHGGSDLDPGSTMCIYCGDEGPNP
jgi:hypothetical protein